LSVVTLSELPQKTDQQLFLRIAKNKKKKKKFYFMQHSINQYSLQTCL